MAFGCHDTPKLPSIPFAEEMMTHDFADKSADCCVTALVLGEWQRSGYRRLFFLPDAVRHSQTTRVEAQELTAAVYWLVSGSSFVSKCRSAPLRRSRIILIGRSSRKQQSQERGAKLGENLDFRSFSRYKQIVWRDEHGSYLPSIELRSRRDWFGFKFRPITKPTSPPVSGCPIKWARLR